ncbi:MAG: hypothetical protein HXY34_05570 [Candidatus Thorarchaeota archaeon]|nr:hypothetical protein [Candidatus Thorarchaeota archaeon]
MRLIRSLDHWARTYVLYVVTIIALVTGAAMMFLVPGIVGLSGGLPILDMRLFYSYDEMTQLFGALGPEGLSLYGQLQLLDSVFPAAYGLAFCLMTLRLANGIEYLVRYRVLALLSLLAAFFDYLENIAIAMMIHSYPAVAEANVLLSASFTAIKWILLSTGVILLLMFLLIALVQRARRA